MRVDVDVEGNPMHVRQQQLPATRLRGFLLRKDNHLPTLSDRRNGDDCTAPLAPRRPFVAVYAHVYSYRGRSRGRRGHRSRFRHSFFTRSFSFTSVAPPRTATITVLHTFCTAQFATTKSDLPAISVPSIKLFLVSSPL
ncbi:unnamed protein product [Schistocephalus solidus]|uniref:Uncharacterized protein n=1 Tax=Schistocephalus solidus TaxID=70667 RepID=A0A183TBL3_SCHSO|nr:unnamed protein product [Schistocephalus solidus]